MTKYALVADDNDVVREFVGRALHRLGYDTTIIECPPRDISACLHNDLVITDYSMPGETGISFAKRLREGGFEKPIVLITGDDDGIGGKHVLDAAKKSELFYRILKKPVNLNDIRSVLAALSETEQLQV